MIDFFRYSSIIYLLGIILLIAVLIFGNEVKGAKSWFSLMGFSLQPSNYETNNRFSFGKISE